MSSSLSVNNQICDPEGCFAAVEEEIKDSERHLHSKSKLGLIIKRASLCERGGDGLSLHCNSDGLWKWELQCYPRGVSDSTKSRGGREMTEFFKYRGGRG